MAVKANTNKHTHIINKQMQVSKTIQTNKTKKVYKILKNGKKKIIKVDKPKIQEN